MYGRLPTGKPWTPGSSNLMQVSQVYIKTEYVGGGGHYITLVINKIKIHFRTLLIHSSLLSGCVSSVSRFKTYNSYIRVDVVQRS